MNESGVGGFQDHPELINRQGRPPAGVAGAEMAREFFKGKDPRRRKIRFRALLEKNYERALKNSDSAMRLCFQYFLGMPVQKIDMENTKLDALMEAMDKI